MPNTYTWTNAAGGVWTTGSNWGGVYPTFAAGDIANFTTVNITGAVSVTGVPGAGLTIGQLWLGDSVGASGGWTFTGTAPGFILDSGVTQPIIRVDSSTSTLSTGMSLTGSTNGFQKTGAGTLLITIATGITGTLTITAGTVQMGTTSLNGAIASISAIAVASGASFVNARSGGQVDATISGAGTVQKSGSGTGVFTGNASAFTGTLIVDAGLTASFDPTSSPATWACNITGAGGISKAQFKDLVLSGTASSFTGGINVGAGTLTITGSVTGTGTVTMVANSILALSGNGAITQKTLSFVGTTGFSLRNGATCPRDISCNGTGPTSLGLGVFNADGSITAYSGQLTLLNTATLRVEANGTHTFSGTLGTATFATTIQTDTGATFVLSGTTSGSGSITKTSAGKLRLVGPALAGTGAVTISAGDLEVSPTSGNSLNFPSTLTFSSAASTLKFAA